MVQHKAARYINKDYKWTSSVTAMLQDLNWDTLETRRNKLKLTLMYKVVNGTVDIEVKDYLTRPARDTRKKHKHKFSTIGASKDPFKFSFFPSTVPSWNNLPAVVAEAPSLASFKGGLSKISI